MKLDRSHVFSQVCVPVCVCVGVCTYSFTAGCEVSPDGWHCDIHQSLLKYLLPHCAAIIVILLKKIKMGLNPSLKN